MGIFDDYINNLENETNLDPVTIARELRELHTTEIGTRQAKIEQLESTVSEKESAIAAKESEISKWKAKNFDLVMQIPDNNNLPKTNDTDPNKDSDKPDGSSIRIKDLFKKEVSNRHGI